MDRKGTCHFRRACGLMPPADDSRSCRWRVAQRDRRTRQSFVDDDEHGTLSTSCSEACPSTRGPGRIREAARCEGQRLSVKSCAQQSALNRMGNERLRWGECSRIPQFDFESTHLWSARAGPRMTQRGAGRQMLTGWRKALAGAVRHPWSIIVGWRGEAKRFQELSGIARRARMPRGRVHETNHRL